MNRSALVKGFELTNSNIPGSARHTPWLNSPAFWCVVGSTIALALRIALFDWSILAAMHFPNHDLSQGAGFFAINLHSIRVEGDIAWWKSNAFNGYAHYYQTFLSPLAPTPSHISFLLVAAAMWTLDRLHFVVSEYQYYVFTNFVLLVWCAIAGFGWLVSQFSQRPFAIVFSCIVYAFSTIGLWEGSWFYFQEPATFNFLLGSTIALMNGQTRTRASLFLVAVLIQVASINFWTLYNLFFFVVFVGSYVCFFPTKARRALSGLTALPKIATIPTLAVCLLWIGLIASIGLEQSGRYTRPEVEGFGGVGEKYTVETVIKRAQSMKPEHAIVSLGDPVAMFRHADGNPMHFSRYVGLITLGLMFGLVFLRRDRVVAWLIVTLLGTAYIVFAPSPVVWLWAHIPMMDRIQHVFYFYPHYVAQLVVIMAALSIDAMLGRERNFRVAAYICVALATAELSVYFALASRLDRDYTERVIWPQMSPMTPAKRKALLTALPPLSKSTFEGGVSDALPIRTRVFPNNDFLMRNEVFALRYNAPALNEGLIGAPIEFLPSGGERGPISFVPQNWSYNSFVFEVDAPSAGNLIIRQAPDPAWRINMDNVPTRINPIFSGLAISIPVLKGHHVIQMDYRPLARHLYWPASVLLGLNIAFLLSGLSSRRRRDRPSTSETARGLVGCRDRNDEAARPVCSVT